MKNKCFIIPSYLSKIVSWKNNQKLWKVVTGKGPSCPCIQEDLSSHTSTEYIYLNSPILFNYCGDATSWLTTDNFVDSRLSQLPMPKFRNDVKK